MRPPLPSPRVEGAASLHAGQGRAGVAERAATMFRSNESASGLTKSRARAPVRLLQLALSRLLEAAMDGIRREPRLALLLGLALARLPRSARHAPRLVSNNLGFA